MQLALMGIIPGDIPCFAGAAVSASASLLLVVMLRVSHMCKLYEEAHVCMVTAGIFVGIGVGLLNFYTLWLLIVLYLHRKKNMVGIPISTGT